MFPTCFSDPKSVIETRVTQCFVIFSSSLYLNVCESEKAIDHPLHPSSIYRPSSQSAAETRACRESLFKQIVNASRHRVSVTCATDVMSCDAGGWSRGTLTSGDLSRDWSSITLCDCCFSAAVIYLHSTFEPPSPSSVTADQSARLARAASTCSVRCSVRSDTR